jgi:hypothetical protein
MIAAVLAGLFVSGSLYFAARNHDDQIPVSVTGKRRRQQ